MARFKYTKVKQLQKMLSKLDPEADIFFDAALPKAIQKYVPNLYFNLKEPKFRDEYTDIDGSRHVWCYFKIEIDN